MWVLSSGDRNISETPGEQVLTRSSHLELRFDLERCNSIDLEAKLVDLILKAGQLIRFQEVKS